jgi:F-type H+-transporting ATPase subunit gamma
MATLREIRRRISSIQSTQQITKAMKMVAAAKLRRAQERALSMRPYTEKLSEMVGNLAQNAEQSNNSLLIQKPVEKVLIVVVTADKGLCGMFNSSVIKEAVRLINNMHDKELQVFPVGKKAKEYFSKRDYIIYSSKSDFFNHLQFSDATEISKNLIQSYQDNHFDKIDIIYNKFKSAVKQELTIEQFLPLAPPDESEDEKSSEISNVDYIYEPGKLEILAAIIPKHLNVQIWKILAESNAAEHAARMTAMENATENAEELLAKLTLTYNRARQAAITTEITEIVGGAEALKDN